MEQTITRWAGVDIVDQRYVVCLLNEEGKNPKYYSGRSDTANGQEKFFSLIEGRNIVIPPDSLATMAFHRLGSDRVIINREYDAYYASGIERGERMARFAALICIHSEQEGSVLSAKEQKELLTQQQSELDSLIAFADEVGPLMERLLNGSASPKDVERMIQLEVQSRYPSTTVTPPLVVEELLDPKEDTFFACLFRYLKSLT